MRRKKNKIKSKKVRQRNNYILGLFSGVVFGLLMGYAMENIIAGLVVGVALGFGMGYAINKTIGT